uniref:Uncharacterized protein n=1 Tax=Arundo donax TaxID=35708 RepID=A0A0A9E5B1_ARUDO
MGCTPPRFILSHRRRTNKRRGRSKSVGRRRGGERRPSTREYLGGNWRKARLAVSRRRR